MGLLNHYYGATIAGKQTMGAKRW